MAAKVFFRLPANSGCKFTQCLHLLPSVTEVDYLIAGQGLAGSVLAWTALRRGRSVVVADPDPKGSTSRAAAGLVNPILGPRLVPSWRYQELWGCARTFYRERESDLGVSFLHETPLVRYFADDSQKALWMKKRHRPEFEGLWEPCPDHPHDAFLCPGAAWLDLCTFLNHSAPRLPLRLDAVDPAHLHLEPDSVRWKDLRARFVIFCEGHAIQRNPLFRFIPVRLASGDMITLHLPGWEETRILHRVKWVLPTGDHHFRLGATYDWPGTPGGVSSEPAAERILSALRPILPTPLPPPPYPVASGIRPMAQHGVPFLGTHPLHPRLAVLNGLGAKGVLLTPFFSSHLLDHLETGSPLDPAVDAKHFWKS